MFNLERLERIITIFLIFGILVGLGIIAYKKTHSNVDIEIKNSSILIDRPNKIDINRAGLEELMKLKGVGRVLAGRIIDYRAQKGHFNSITEIKDVKGIGDKFFDGIKDDIVVE